MDTKSRTKTLLPQLQKIGRGSYTHRCLHIKNAQPCLIKYVSDAAGALLRTDIQLPQEKYPKLKKYKNTLLFLAKKKPSLGEKRKKLLEQKGGFIQFLIPALVSGLAGFVGRTVAGSTF